MEIFTSTKTIVLRWEKNNCVRVKNFLLKWWFKIRVKLFSLYRHQIHIKIDLMSLFYSTVFWFSLHTVKCRKNNCIVLGYLWRTLLSCICLIADTIWLNTNTNFRICSCFRGLGPLLTFPPGKIRPNKFWTVICYTVKYSHKLYPPIFIISYNLTSPQGSEDQFCLENIQSAAKDVF